MNNLQLSLIEKWFKMTKTGEKTEDYREISPYFCNRFLLQNGKTMSKEWWGKYLHFYKIKSLKESLETNCQIHRITFKQFENNIMTLGYPKSTDTDRILKMEHKGIDIGTGTPDWGAVEGKFFFFVKHGSVL